MASLPSLRRLVSVPALLALAVLGSAARPAAATTYMMVPDPVLTDQATVIAEVRVVSVEPSPAQGIPSTDHLVEIDRLLKGFTSGSSIVVRLPGGVRPDGMGLRIFGAPDLREGARALLFLRERADGAYGVLHLALGAFREVKVGNQSLAVRDLSEATQVQIKGGRIEPVKKDDLPRDLGRFADWVADRVNGVQRQPDYFVRPNAERLQAITDEFTLSTDPRSGRNIRWFSFDTGGSVTFRAHANGQPGVPGGGFGEFQRALQVWNDEPTTPVRYVYGGTTTATRGFTSFDSVNSILFADPNQEIEGTFACGAGGILAIGGPWFSSSNTASFRGTTYVRAQGADIVTNDGIECSLSGAANPSNTAAALFAHELGHTLGISHSSEARAEPNSTLRNALMYAFLVNGSAGPVLNSDDIAALRRLYDPNQAVAGQPCRANNNTLCLQKSRFRVEVAWTNQFNNTSGVGRALPRTDVTGFFSFGDPSNVELMVKILDFGDVIKVFYGQLTNLRFTITVTDTRTGTVKTYQNTPGDCGGIDNQGFPRALTAPLTDASSGLSAAPSAATRAACRGDRDTLCLQNGRFAVEVDWRNQHNGQAGRGQAGTLSQLTGVFSFTDPSNVELMTKLVNLGDRIAFFYGSLSDLEYTIRVTDTSSGVVKTYVNPAGRVCGGLDNNAF